MHATGKELADMMTLARLHSALDSVLETEALIAQVEATTVIPSPSVTRLARLLVEARDTLRALLAPAGAVGPAGMRRDLGTS